MTSTNNDLLRGVHEAFTPSTPITSSTLFAGRTAQTSNFVKGFIEAGQHLVLYGERGVGKTSLANILTATLRSQGISAVGTSCTNSDTFSSIWLRILSQISITMHRSGIGFGAETGTTAITGAELAGMASAQAANLALQLQTIGLRGLVILDEYDQVRDPQARQEFASLLKILSDSNSPIKLLIVGVATDVAKLVGDHASIERCIRQIFVPRMSTSELEEIIKKGESVAGISFDQSVATAIVRISQGFPHYTHLLAKASALHAAHQDRREVGWQDLVEGVSAAIDSSNETIRSSYRRATDAVHSSLYEHVLLAAALVQSDEESSFRPADLIEPLSSILKRQISLQGFFPHLGKLCGEDRGSILERLGTKKPFRYRFANPLMRPFVYLIGFKNNDGIATRLKQTTETAGSKT